MLFKLLMGLELSLREYRMFVVVDIATQVDRVQFLLSWSDLS